MEHRFYLGIDLDDQYAVISSYELNKKEPETFSAIAGSEIYQIPALITKKKGIGQWFVGEEAVRLAIAQGEEANGDFSRGRSAGEKVFVDGETYPAEELLTLISEKTDTTAGRPTEDGSRNGWSSVWKSCRGRRRSCSFRWRRSLELTGKSCSCLTGKNVFTILPTIRCRNFRCTTCICSITAGRISAAADYIRKNARRRS